MKRFAPLLLCGLAFAQTNQPKLSFEAAAIRPSAPGGAMFYRADDGNATGSGMSLHSLISHAFGLPDDQLIQPNWTMDVVFDVHAKLPAGAHKEQVPQMLQTMLEERFGLKIHHEQKTIPVYALVVAKDGPKLSAAKLKDTPDPECNGGFHKVCEQVTMDDFANMLTAFARMKVIGALDRPVANETGLTGKFDFVFDSGRVGGRQRIDAPPADDAEMVSPIDAVKALGLRLEPSKHTYDIVVVDHVERTPTEN